MLPTHILAALLTALTAVSGSPTPLDSLDAALESGDNFDELVDLPSDVENDIETIYFKREAVISARDLNLATEHGVDANEMWKHSVIRRSDGNDITFWVHNSWVDGEQELPDDATDEEENHLETRQVESYKFNKGGNSRCRKTKIEGRTNSRSPSTGAAQRIVDWSRKHKGYFTHTNVYRSVRMVAARAGNGGHAEFSARKMSVNKLRPNIYVGTKDIADIVQASINRYKKRAGGGSWRVQTRGTSNCEANGVSGKGRANVSWALSRSGVWR